MVKFTLLRRHHMASDHDWHGHANLHGQLPQTTETMRKQPIVTYLYVGETERLGEEGWNSILTTTKKSHEDLMKHPLFS